MEAELLLSNYEKYLRKEEAAENTIKTYTCTVRHFLVTYDNISKKNLLQYKENLIANYRPSTVNTKILAVNNFLHFMKKDSLKLKTVKIQQKTFLDNVISNSDYRKLIRNLKENGQIKWYMIIHTMACTGARISEVVSFQIEDVYSGYAELYAKGAKLRRIYFPKVLQKELSKWVETENRTEGSLFLNKDGVTISASGVNRMLKHFAKRYKIDQRVMHPHSFRHRFSLNFLAKKPNEIILLADILGHSNINTTRIYTRRTSQEQYRIINSVVDW